MNLNIKNNIQQNKKMMSSNTNYATKQQGFKKKNSINGGDLNNLKTNDKFGDLKSKLEKQKQMMRKTGRRFREEASISTQQVSISTDREQSSNGQRKKHDISIGPQEIIKPTISLKDISIMDKSSKKQNLGASQLFQKQIKNQKKRSEQVYLFLKKIQLQMFADPLINNGFDDLQTLAQVKTDDLNNVMMRAYQQIKLVEALKPLKQKISQQLIKQKQSTETKSTLWRIKTQSMEPLTSRSSKMSSSQLIQRLKTQRKTEKQPFLLKPGSFLYTCGTRNWSIQDQIRRACSVCFKVEQQMQKKGQCYYCKKCFKSVSEDIMDVSLSRPFSRQYRKLQ